FFSSRRRHTRWPRDWSSDVCSSDLVIIYLLISNAIEHIDTKKNEQINNPVIWIIIIAIFTPVAIGLMIFGWYATKNEYDHLPERDRKSTRLNSSHVAISYAVFCLKK